MIARSPWHSLTEGVHHQHDECVCGIGALAIPDVLRTGEGGKPLCDTCAMLVQRDVVATNVPAKAPEQK